MTRLNRASARRSRIVLLCLATALGALVIGFAPRGAEAAPAARFTATPVQGTTCVAPCIVHLDATATTSTDTTRPYHELDYAWSCGEPGAGNWPTKLGGSKNAPRGPISGCVYDTPGAKTIDLTVRGGDGATSIARQTVQVAAPWDHFGAQGIYCFRSSATGDFRGCPLDRDSNGSCEMDPGGHCATQASFTSALNSCGANTAQRACYFRRGDTFSGGGAYGLSRNGSPTAPGVVGSFGPATSPRPLLTGATGIVTLRPHWTVHGLQAQFTSGSMFPALGTEERSVSVYQVAASGPMNSCISNATGGGSVFTDLLALVEMDCNSTAIEATAMFLRAERALVLGTRENSNGTGEFSLRTVHWWKSAIQHSDFLSPGNPALGGARGDRNPIQIRSWAQSTNVEAPSGNGPPPKETRFVVISDNHLSWHGGGNAGHAIRVCQNNDCTTMAGGSGAGDPQDAVDILVERNFVTFDGHSTGANLAAGLVWAQGGRMTIRNNVLDLQGLSGASSSNRLVRQSPSYTDCDGCTSSEIVVQNNTVYYDEATGDSFELCSFVEGTGHVCQGNLVWRPNDVGARNAELSGGSAATGGNLFATSNPFVGAPPDRGQSMPAHFQLTATSTAKDRLSGGARDVVIDFAGGCRAPAATIDAGAWEQGALACSGDSTPVAVCGDRRIDTGETCDDGNTANGDGCSSICLVEGPSCGNGRLESGERCDDGNLVGGDGCRANCSIEVCGDTIVDPGEGCDDGNATAGDGCSAICVVEAAACGNGRLESGETCDDGNLAAGDGCRANCSIERCGDHIVDPSESCDDGNLASGDGCSALCVVEAPACGNGRIETGERCDDGNLAAGDGCRADCSIEACGDRIVDPRESCDDGNTASGDGCSAVCLAEASGCGDGTLGVGETCDDGNQIGGDGCRANCSIEICGDHLLDGAEACDDGNLAAGDGCSATCTVEMSPGSDEHWINVGGPDFGDVNGDTWHTDAPFASGGRTATDVIEIRNTDLDPLFQSRRYATATGAPLVIELPVPDTGPYRVRLYFAELDRNVGRGQRVFDAVVEEVVRMRDLDVYRAAGGAKPLVRETYVNVDDGLLTVRLEARIGEPMISGIQVLKGNPPTGQPRFVTVRASDERH